MKKKIEKTKRDIVKEVKSLRSELKEMKENLGKVDQTEKMEAFKKKTG